MPLISCASSSASSGLGGEPFLIMRIAIRPAITPSSRIAAPVIRKPSQKSDSLPIRSQIPHDSACSR